MSEMNQLSFQEIETMVKSVCGEINGTDSFGASYSSLSQFWDMQLKRNGNIPGVSNWYTQAYDYWESETNCPATDDGVLGGYGVLTPLDVKDSIKFINKCREIRPLLLLKTVADLGAGCGRVSKNLLLPLFEEVHLFEQSQRLVDEAPAYIGKPDSDRVVCTAQVLQDFKPEPDTYDVIWIQWVIGHLHDLDFITFFRNAARGLKKNGIIILKDNCTESLTFNFDNDDSSVVRAPAYMRLLFHLAGLNIVLEQVQQDFPEELCPVHMFALEAPPQRPA